MALGQLQGNILRLEKFQSSVILKLMQTKSSYFSNEQLPFPDMCNTVSPNPRKRVSVLHSGGPALTATAAAAAEVMRETSSVPAIHILTHAMPSERTPPRGRTWNCLLPSMEIIDM